MKSFPHQDIELLPRHAVEWSNWCRSCNSFIMGPTAFECDLCRHGVHGYCLLMYKGRYICDNDAAMLAAQEKKLCSVDEGLSKFAATQQPRAIMMYVLLNFFSDSVLPFLLFVFLILIFR